jgi:Uri superfamily endonuclease
MEINYQALPAQIPPLPGTYLLLSALREQKVIQVGMLGLFVFPPGYYLYVGSALGPGGLAGRLNRHLDYKQRARSAHWHIDYLAREADLVEITYIEDPIRREHTWTRTLGALETATMPASKFGASDCRCLSHLFHFPTWPGDKLISLLGYGGISIPDKLTTIRVNEDLSLANRRS